MSEGSCCGEKTTRNLKVTSFPCANDVRKAIDMSLTYIGDKEATGKEHFLDKIKQTIEREASLQCSDDTCDNREAKCMFDYEIGEIRSTQVVKPGGKTQLHGKTVSDGCWRFEATVLCGCWCVAAV